MCVGAMRWSSSEGSVSLLSCRDAVTLSPPTGDSGVRYISCCDNDALSDGSDYLEQARIAAATSPPAPRAPELFTSLLTALGSMLISGKSLASPDLLSPAVRAAGMSDSFLLPPRPWHVQSQYARF